MNNVKVLQKYTVVIHVEKDLLMHIYNSGPLFNNNEDNNSIQKNENEEKITKSVFDFDGNGIISEEEATRYLSKYDNHTGTFKELLYEFVDNVCNIYDNVDNIIQSFIPRFEALKEPEEGSKEYNAMQVVKNTTLNVGTKEEYMALMNSIKEQGGRKIVINESYPKDAPPKADISYTIGDEDYILNVNLSEDNIGSPDGKNHLDELFAMTKGVTTDNIDETISKMKELGAKRVTASIKDTDDVVITFLYKSPDGHTEKYSINSQGQRGQYQSTIYTEVTVKF